MELGSGSKLRSTYLPNESVMYGRDDDKEFVFNWLTSNTAKNHSVLSIVGMPGLGKTALAQHVFNDPRMSQAIFDIKVWVCVSDEFDVFNISRAILEGVTRSTDDSRDTEMVHRRLKEKLTGNKFLLVLDDVWYKNQSKWEEVQKVLVSEPKGVGFLSLHVIRTLLLPCGPKNTFQNYYRKMIAGSCLLNMHFVMMILNQIQSAGILPWRLLKNVKDYLWP